MVVQVSKRRRPGRWVSATGVGTLPHEADSFMLIKAVLAGLVQCPLPWQAADLAADIGGRSEPTQSRPGRSYLLILAVPEGPTR